MFAEMPRDVGSGKLGNRHGGANADALSLESFRKSSKSHSFSLSQFARKILPSQLLQQFAEKRRWTSASAAPAASLMASQVK
jgi:hypothetical protein